MRPCFSSALPSSIIATAEFRDAAGGMLSAPAAAAVMQVLSRSGICPPLRICLVPYVGGMHAMWNHFSRGKRTLAPDHGAWIVEQAARRKTRQTTQPFLFGLG